MTNATKSTLKGNGFTIVELLVVIVVIGILAAITMVSYTGVTAKANTASAISTAGNLSNKLEVYNVDSGINTYPATLAAITGAAATTTYYMGGVTLAPSNSTAVMSVAPATPSTVNFLRCGTSGAVAAPTTYALTTATTGVRIGYWNYSTSTMNYDDVGIVSGLVGTFNVACFGSAS